MTTRSGLRDIIREVLADVTQWPDATLNIWINQAIRDYSLYFPYHQSATVLVESGKAYQTLGATYCPGIIDILKIEFPVGNDPPTLLQRLSRNSPSFPHNNYYDTIGDPPTMLYIGPTPAINTNALIAYTVLHTIPTADNSVLTVPDIHLEALAMFCKWKAIEESEMEEMLNPDTTEFILTQIGLNAIRAERIYISKLREYRAASVGERSSPGWQMDKWDRTY